MSARRLRRLKALPAELIARHDVRGNLVPDAQLAALALEHGLSVCSNDTDFAQPMVSSNSAR